MTDQEYMLRAISLAKKGQGFTNPNPMVGAVIVKNNEIIGEGYHARCGELHAERNALAALSKPAKDATLYVTLEPCCHHGKTPPCTDAIIEHGIKKVVIGSRDPNPLVAGKGAAILREHGIEVVEDFMRSECDAINPVFFHYITTKTPYIVAKYAMTADGKIATKTGASKWITGEAARNQVHQLRHRYMGIMVGINTVLADDPMLTTRIDGLKSPIRIIVDSNLRIPLTSQICKSSGQYRTILAFVKEDNEKQKALEKMGMDLLKLPSKDNQVDLESLLSALGELGIDSILVEGGGTLLDAFRAHQKINQAEVYIAPKLFGGKSAKTPLSGVGISEVNEALMLQLTNVEQLGDDLHLTYQISGR